MKMERVVILNLLILRTVVNPISYLRNIMMKIEKSGPGLLLSIISRDEIGDLSKALNKMSKALNSSYDRNYKQKKKLAKSLNEKNILFKELHHRVKNNLNMILAMIEIQIENMDDIKIIDNLKKLQNHIYSIALIYKLLYKMQEID